MAKTQLITDDLAEMLALIEGADSVELKLTVPHSDHRTAAGALGIDPLDAQIRQACADGLRVIVQVPCANLRRQRTSAE